MSGIRIVGIGPGDRRNMTEHAIAAIDGADILCGYDKYVELVAAMFPGKPTLTSGMTREIERCRAALAAAAGGKTVAMVCSGDAGVYGMAGLVYELSPDYPPLDIEVVPGVSAAMSGAAVLGAPLMHDFAVISLSDLLTPWEMIAKRLRGAAAADFVICLYNPASRKRRDHLALACDIVMEYRDAKTVCGWVRNIGREGRDSAVLSLKALRDWDSDMFSTIFIGSSATTSLNGKMVTPRGYMGQKA